MLGGFGALCRSGTSLAPTAPWSYYIERGFPLLPPSSPLHWHRAALALILEEQSVALGAPGSFGHRQCVSSSCTPSAPGAKHSLGVCTPGELGAGRGNGQHDPVCGFLSIKLALLPLSFVPWMGLEQLPEKGISQCSIPQEGGGSWISSHGPDPHGGAGDKRHPNLQPRELLVFATLP